MFGSSRSGRYRDSGITLFGGEWSPTGGNKSYSGLNLGPGGMWVIIMLIGLVFFALGLYQMRSYMSSARWDTTQAQIITSRVDTRVKWRTRNGRRYQDYDYYADIKYQYNVNGIWYENSRITFDDGFCFQDNCLGQIERGQIAAQQLVQRYPAGGYATIHYNPSQPGESVLERSINDIVWVMIAGGGLALAIGLTFTIADYMDW